MPQDAFTIYHTARELDQIVSGGKIERINQPDKNSVEFFVRNNNKNHTLTVNVNADYARVCVSNAKSEAPVEAPSFCMLLRKHLQRATIDRVYAIKYERIAVIDLTCRDELGTPSKKSLYCEIMGKYSNLTLVESNVILGAIKTTGMDQNIERPIYVGGIYSLPKPQDKVDPSDLKSFENLFNEYDNSIGLSNFIFESVNLIDGKTCNLTKFQVNIYSIRSSDCNLICHCKTSVIILVKS